MEGKGTKFNRYEIERFFKEKIEPILEQASISEKFLEITRKLLRATFLRPEARRLPLIAGVICEEMGAKGGLFGVRLDKENRCFGDTVFVGDLKGDDREEKVLNWVWDEVMSAQDIPQSILLNAIGISQEGWVVATPLCLPDIDVTIDTIEPFGVLCLSRRDDVWSENQLDWVVETGNFIATTLIWFFASASLPEYAQRVFNEFRKTGRLH